MLASSAIKPERLCSQRSAVNWCGECLSFLTYLRARVDRQSLIVVSDHSQFLASSSG